MAPPPKKITPKSAHHAEYAESLRVAEQALILRDTVKRIPTSAERAEFDTKLAEAHASKESVS